MTMKTTDIKKLSLNGIALDRKERNEGENLIRIGGYAAHFGKVNGNGEIVTEDSFRNFFEMLQEGGQMPMLTYNHNSDLLIGGWDKITADDKGLYAEGHINADVALVRDTILPLMESGDLNGLSTEGWYDWNTASVNDDGSVNIADYALTAISLVALPADFAAKVESRNALKLERETTSEENTENENNTFLFI